MRAHRRPSWTCHQLRVVLLALIHELERHGSLGLEVAAADDATAHRCPIRRGRAVRRPVSDGLQQPRRLSVHKSRRVCRVTLLVALFVNDVSFHIDP